jgi:hypothetical protein
MKEWWKELISEEGTAATEMVVLLPVFVLLVVAALGFGEIGKVIVESPQAARYVTYLGGVQQSGDIRNSFYGGVKGQANVVDSTVDASPPQGEIIAVLDEVALGGVYGQFSMVNGQIVYNNNAQSPYEGFIVNNRLREDYSPTTADVMSGYQSRTDGTVSFVYAPFFVSDSAKIEAREKFTGMTRGEKVRVGPAGPTIQTQLLPRFQNYQPWEPYGDTQELWSPQ